MLIISTMTTHMYINMSASQWLDIYFSETNILQFPSILMHLIQWWIYITELWYQSSVYNYIMSIYEFLDQSLPVGNTEDFNRKNTPNLIKYSFYIQAIFQFKIENAGYVPHSHPW